MAVIFKFYPAYGDTGGMRHCATAEGAAHYLHKVLSVGEKASINKKGLVKAIKAIRVNKEVSIFNRRISKITLFGG